MALNLTQELRQTQRLIMTPQLQISIQMLQMPTMELEQRIRQEVMNNPFLELSDDETSSTEEIPTSSENNDSITPSDNVEVKEASEEGIRKEEQVEESDSEKEEGEKVLDNPISSNVETFDSDESPSENLLENDSAKFDEIDVSWDEIYDDSYTFRPSYQKEDFEERDFTEFVSIRETVFENLKRQLRLSTLSGLDFQIGEYLIGNLDDNGYLTVTMDETATLFKVPVERVVGVLKVVQTFEPTGIAARDLKECLKIQLEEQGVDNHLIYEILDKYLNLLQRKKFREIAKKLNVSVHQVINIFDKISKLEPKPGRSLSNEQAVYVKPDVIVKKIDDKYIYFLNEGEVTNLKINSLYRNLLKSNNTFSKSEREFATEKLRSAVWLMKNIEKRKSTILRVTEVIIEHQKGFIEKGIEYLKPLTLREVAEIVKMHESTIARVTNGKYVETPRGIFELKYFFSSGIENDLGEMESSKSVRRRIQKLIESESAKKPLSDQKISQALSKEGIQIARRTVAKYREQLKILPAKYRKTV